MIHLQMLGLAGNNLFQYAVARILSEDLGFALSVTHSPYKPEKNIPQLEALLAHFHDAPLELPGKAFEGPIDRTAQLGHGDFDGYCLDLDAMRANTAERRIEVEGYFERYELFRNHKDRIRRWYALEPTTHGHNVGADDIVVHIRRGDFIPHGRAISLSYYLDLLRTLSFRRLYVCGFGLDHEVRQAFREFNPVYVHGEPVDDFRFMAGFNRMVLSQSTFAWWAGFLSRAEEIHAPLTIPGATAFAREHPNIDLRVDDEPRYHYTEDVAHLERDFGLFDLIRSRQHLHRHDLAVMLPRWATRKWQAGSEWSRALLARVRAGEIGTVQRAREIVRWQWIYRRRNYRGNQYRFRVVSEPVLGKYRKIVIIRMNHSYAGFFAYFTFALNQILFCERNNCLPVVFFGEWSSDGDNAYFDAARGPNMWEYYFEPVAEHDYAEVQSWLDDPDHPVGSDDVVTLTDEDLWYLHLFEKESVFAYTYGRHMLRTRPDPAWYDEQRIRAHEVIRRRIRVKPHIEARVNGFAEQHMVGRPMLGVHLRGTDKGAARGAANTRRKMGPEGYFTAISRYLRDHPDAGIFAATDQAQYLDVLHERYGDRVVSTDCLRSTGDLAPFQLSEGSGYDKGAEVLTDALLLSRCNFLLKCSSHVGEAALWFNPSIPSHDVNYDR